MARAWIGVGIAALLLALAPLTGAQEAPPPADAATKVRVGVSEFAPLVVLGDGAPRGFDVELWQAAAGRVKLDTEWVVVKDLPDLLGRVARGELDAALSGITINARREATVDFSHPYLRSGLGIMVPATTTTPLQAALSRLFSADTLPWLGGGLAFILLSALLCWWSEQGNDASFQDAFNPGYFEAVYWTIVTMSTVGYGDYAPRRWLGRIVAVFVIFSGVGLYGTLVAKGAALMTVDELQGEIRGPSDLRGRAVATVRGTTSVDALVGLGARPVEVERIEDAYARLGRGEVEAVTYDLPTLQHHLQTGAAGKAVLVGQGFDHQYYGFAFPPGSTLRERINCALLEMQESGTFEKLYERTFGKRLTE